MTRAFTTSFGTRIPLVEGYRDVHPRLSIADITTPYAEMVPSRLGIEGFIRDVYEYALMIDFLENLGVRTRWPRALDLGGAEGTMSRLLRAEGRADHVVTIDASDAGGALTTEGFLRLWARFRAAAFASRFSPRLRRFLLGDDVWRGRRLAPIYNHWGYWPPASSTFWRPRLRRLPLLDRYIAGDVYDLEERFDLVTAFFCLDYFDLEKIFAKLSALLVEGGTLFIAVNYWWYAANSTLLVGDFPYCAQRLTREDFQRYLREFRPQDEPDALARYDYYHGGVMRPTLDDYVTLGDRYGLALIGSQRLLPPRDIHHRATVAPRLLNQFADTRLSDVLDDIRKFRPDVGLIDLQTAHVMVAFEKRTPRRESLADHLRSEEWRAALRDVERRIILDRPRDGGR